MRSACVLALVSILAVAGAVYAGDPWEGIFEKRAPGPMDPGGYFNPYVVRKDSSGDLEIKPELPSAAPGHTITEPGGYLNPLVVEKSGEGQYEIRADSPLGHDVFKPGGYLNPYVVRQRPNGDVEIRPSLPFGQ